jgi:hypothetical protein
LLPVSVAEARAMGDLDGTAFRIIKENRVDVIAGRVQNRLAEKQRRFLDLWYSPRARELLLEAKEKFKPSKER